MKLISKTALQIQKPITEVFDGIVNPSKMTQYFISESTRLMETGKDLMWKSQNSLRGILLQKLLLNTPVPYVSFGIPKQLFLFH